MSTDDDGTNKQKRTVSLSSATLEMIHELRCTTDADTMSEVVRNAIRVHYTLLGAEREGNEIMCGRQLLTLNMFAKKS